MIVKGYLWHMDDFVGIAEIAGMLRITTQRVDQLARTHDAFPAPVADLSAGRIWLKADIEEWARKTGRLT